MSTEIRRSSVLPEAMLLLGPTGSGKTPFGELLELEGVAGRKCFHFDFGSRLRRYASNPTGILSGVELAVIDNSLRTGALLTDEQFPIAEKLLGGYIDETGAAGSDLIVLNGLPRHAGQAAALEKIVRITVMVVLDCDAATVMERIRTDAGGDRGGRIDDKIDDVKRKLAIFAEKTLPLVRFYEERSVPVIRVGIGVCDSAAATRDSLAEKLTQVFC
jgi:adenylate kinase